MKDGKLSIEGCIKIGEMTGDPQRAKNVELVSRECESTVGTDRYNIFELTLFKV